VDDHLVDRMSGRAELRLHPPTPREVALVGDNPWEGTLCAHYTVFRDGNRCRMYYRGANEPSPNAASSGTSPAFICYAESQDGIRWTKIYGDSLERTVRWNAGRDLQALVGRPVRLGFELKDADLYSFRFQK
jgi:hypothetical protein